MKHRKKIMFNNGKNILMYIANFKCAKNKTTGPVWKIGSSISEDQFHDGFFYGIEDEDGTFTGK